MPRKSRRYSNAAPLFALSLLMGLMSVPKANSHSRQEDFNLQVFQLLTLELWQREFLDR